MKTKLLTAAAHFARCHRAFRRRFAAGRQRRAGFLADRFEGQDADRLAIQRQVRRARMVQSGMPVREEALRQRQHAEAAGRIHRQRRRLAERRFLRAGNGRQPDRRAGRAKIMTDGKRIRPRSCSIRTAKSAEPTARRTRRTCLSSIRRAKSFTKARSTAKRRRIRPTSPSSTNYVKSRARRIDGRQAGLEREDQALRLLGEVQVIARFIKYH